MKPIEVLKAVTSVNAQLFHLEDMVGSIKEGLLADIVVIEGLPDKQIKDLWKVKMVMKGGEIIINN